MKHFENMKDIAKTDNVLGLIILDFDREIDQIISEVVNSNERFV
jgi:hypothetical protein